MLKPKPFTKDYILTDESIEKVKKCIGSWVESLVFYGLLYTGMRVSEFVHLRRRWIDWKEGFIRVPREQPCPCYECKRERRNKKGKVTKPSGVWKPKTKDAVRPIPVLPEVDELFRRFFNKYEAVMDAVPGRVQAWMIIKRLEHKSKVRLFPHVLRGTLATLLASKGFDAVEIKEILGWRSFKTADDYIKLSGVRVKKAVEEKWKRSE